YVECVGWVRASRAGRRGRGFGTGRVVWAPWGGAAPPPRPLGPEAALALLGRAGPAPTPAQGAAPARTLANGTSGARLHPYADLQPAGTRSADLRSLGYTSPGSPG
ncbi:DNA polymerase III subunit alpha, partial [Streptomyces sp. NPDC059411]